MNDIEFRTNKKINWKVICETTISPTTSPGQEEGEKAWLEQRPKVKVLLLFKHIYKVITDNMNYYCFYV